MQLQVTNTGKDERFCEDCVAIPPNSKIHSSSISQGDQICAKESSNPTLATAQQHNQSYTNSRRIVDDDEPYDPNVCAGCREQLKEGQALIALDRQWHISCFRCDHSSILTIWLRLLTFYFFSSISTQLTCFAVAKIVIPFWMANTWAKMASHIAKNATKNCLVSNVPTVIVILAEKFFKLVTIIIFIQLVLGAQNAAIHSVMAKKCICREVLVSGTLLTSVQLSDRAAQTTERIN